MKSLSVALFTLAAVTIGALSIASADTMPSGNAGMSAPLIVTPSSLKWSPCPNIDGCNMAVVWGDPNNKTGAPYDVRLKLADGTKVPVHWHSDSERVTVLSGTLLFAAGNTIDQTKTTALGPGSFVVIPAKVNHYAIAKGDTIVQVGGNGPMTLNVVK